MTFEPRKPASLERRRFLRGLFGSAVALPVRVTLGTLLGVPAALARPGAAEDYRALVGVYLHGGNDSYNMVVPRSAAGHARYAEARGNLAVPRESLLPLEPRTPQAEDLGLHPALEPLLEPFEAGDLALVANVGTLPRPMTAEEARRYPADLPPQLFSHSDQTAQWLSGVPWHSSGFGWGGRALDLLQPHNADLVLPAAINLSDPNRFLVGRQTMPYVLDPEGPEGLDVLSAGEEDPAAEAFLALLERQRDHLLERQFARVQRRAIELQRLVADLLEQQAPLETTFPDSDLGRQLAMIARLIAARERLDHPNGRQFFMAATGGWDTHDQQNQDQPKLYDHLAACLAAFHRAMEEIGEGDRVTLFTASEFGRTLTSNGDGTDHGWGGHQLVLGGAVKGGEIHGEIPPPVIGGPLDLDAGRFVPTQAQAQYAATLVRWFGVEEDGLLALFPHLERFDRLDLGFMAG